MAATAANAQIASKDYVDTNFQAKALVTSLSASSTDATYPSAKAVYDYVDTAVSTGTSTGVTYGEAAGGNVGSATLPVYINAGVAEAITSIPSTSVTGLGTAAALDSTTTIAQDGTGLPTAGTVYTALAAKADSSDLSSYELKSNVTSKGSATNPVYFDENGVATAITSYPYANLTGTPTIDSAVTENSTNAVQSGAVYTALAAKANSTDLGDLAVKDTVDTADIENNAVTGAKMADHTITATQLPEMPAACASADCVLEAHNGVMAWEIIQRAANETLTPSTATSAVSQ